MSGSAPAARAPSPLLLAVAALFVATLVTSNIIAVKVADVGPLTVPAAIVIFPLAYLFGGVLTAVWGYRVGRAVVGTGFIANIVACVFLAPALPSPSNTHHRDW